MSCYSVDDLEVSQDEWRCLKCRTKRNFLVYFMSRLNKFLFTKWKSFQLEMKSVKVISDSFFKLIVVMCKLRLTQISIVKILPKQYSFAKMYAYK